MKNLKTFEQFELYESTLNPDVAKRLFKYLDNVMKALKGISKIKMTIEESKPSLRIDTNGKRIDLVYDKHIHEWMLCGNGKIEEIPEELDITIQKIKKEIDLANIKPSWEVERDSVQQMADDMERNRLNNELTSRQRYYHSR